MLTAYSWKTNYTFSYYSKLFNNQNKVDWNSKIFYKMQKCFTTSGNETNIVTCPLNFQSVYLQLNTEQLTDNPHDEKYTSTIQICKQLQSVQLTDIRIHAAFSIHEHSVSLYIMSDSCARKIQALSDTLTSGKVKKCWLDVGNVGNVINLCRKEQVLSTVLQKHIRFSSATEAYELARCRYIFHSSWHSQWTRKEAIYSAVRALPEYIQPMSPELWFKEDQESLKIRTLLYNNQVKANITCQQIFIVMLNNHFVWLYFVCIFACKVKCE